MDISPFGSANTCGFWKIYPIQFTPPALMMLIVCPLQRTYCVPGGAGGCPQQNLASEALLSPILQRKKWRSRDDQEWCRSQLLSVDPGVEARLHGSEAVSASLSFPVLSCAG